MILEPMGLIVVVIQSLRCVGLLATPWSAAHQASLSFTIFQSLLKLTSTETLLLDCFQLGHWSFLAFEWKHWTFFGLSLLAFRLELVPSALLVLRPYDAEQSYVVSSYGSPACYSWDFSASIISRANIS